jgi:hypothetical protein
LSQADAEFAFNLTDKTMILIQGGGAIKFEKESSQQRR